MALQVEIELGGMNDVSIHDGASRAVPTPICDVGCWKKPDVMPFSDNNDGDLRVYVNRFAGLFDKGKFLLENILKLPFGDPTPEEENAFWFSIRVSVFYASPVVNELVDHRLSHQLQVFDHIDTPFLG